MCIFACIHYIVIYLLSKFFACFYLKRQKSDIVTEKGAIHNLSTIVPLLNLELVNE